MIILFACKSLISLSTIFFLVKINFFNEFSYHFISNKIDDDVANNRSISTCDIICKIFQFTIVNFFLIYRSFFDLFILTRLNNIRINIRVVFVNLYLLNTCFITRKYCSLKAFQFTFFIFVV